ncbi:Isovaleryl-CoA dehydrogenase [Planctomycetales bacterium 10988]|nr:Isovaleryl-CoA dehydrogenase [Planctomycetales bacterium 10988]
MIQSPQDAVLDDLCDYLAEAAIQLDKSGDWPAEQLARCGEQGVFRWFLSGTWGGYDWSMKEVIEGYLRLSGACLSTTFILTQRTGACRRIAGSSNEEIKAELLPKLASGEIFASVGISHLTTSRRHLANPVLQAKETAGGFELNGFSPWVTGGKHCDYIVTGATLDDGRQLLAVVPGDLKGVTCDEPPELMSLTSSHTGSVKFDGVQLDRRWLLDGPIENVMSQGTGARTGGLETSTLAIGLSAAAIGFLQQESDKRADLEEATESLSKEQVRLREAVLSAASGEPVCSTEELRTDANRLAMRSTQAALTAAKGAGFVAGHPAGRWCREALFFLVWSCPQPVTQKLMCEFASLQS